MREVYIRTKGVGEPLGEYDIKGTAILHFSGLHEWKASKRGVVESRQSAWNYVHGHGYDPMLSTRVTDVKVSESGVGSRGAHV
jgi:hypothetical protein